VPQIEGWKQDLDERGMNLLADNERVYRECGRLVLKHGIMPLQVHDVGLADR